MARMCAICGRGKIVARKVSHSNIKTKTLKYPNLQRVRATAGGGVRRINVCTRCIRSGRVTKRVRPGAEG